MCYIYLRLLFGIACLAYHTAIKFALYQILYPEFIVNSFDIKRAAATFVQFACTLHGKHKYILCIAIAGSFSSHARLVALLASRDTRLKTQFPHHKKSNDFTLYAGRGASIHQFPALVAAIFVFEVVCRSGC